MISMLLAASVLATPPANPISYAQASPPSQGTGFERMVLDETFYCEGANFADLDQDGHSDVISGPYIYRGPDFEQRSELYPAKEWDPLHYSDSFFNWTYDLDSDGWLDVVQVCFPGKEGFWYRNPGEAGGAWTRHLMHATVDNESPRFENLVGDETPELVCNSGGAFGYLTQADDPTAAWIFHDLSGDLGKQRFTHGLGVGDVNGDGRQDVLEKQGWWEQPASVEGDPTWTHHAFPFAGPGGAQMFAYDIDGDGDSDVFTSLHAHGWGLAWFEQVPAEGGGTDFIEHTLMGGTREANPYGVRFAAVHALDLVDMDGDGLLDIVTGKRHWSHGPDGDPKAGQPSVIYWFRLERRDDGAHFVPHLIDDDSGVGTQVVAGDINGDGRPDVLVGNKQGTFVFLQSADGAPTSEPALYVAPKRESPNDREGKQAVGADGKALNLGFESGDLGDWTIEGEAFQRQPIRGDTVAERRGSSSDHVGEYWIGGYELLGDGPSGSMTSASFEISADWASFLVGGGANKKLHVELVGEGGKVLASATGSNNEAMMVVVCDLRGKRGQQAHLRIVDEHAGGWGHINFDDFLFHDSEPQIAASRLATSLDVVANAGLTPQEAAEAMTVPEGFHVDLIAAEPDLHQPIALAIDERGRLWVAEAHTYPVRRPEGEGADKILVFEDTTGDGNFDRRVLFADGLNLVSGLEVGFGGVWIGAAPYLMFIPDRDGDLVPDGEPEILLDGWGYEDTHETLNAFNWGPDGWLYGCHGVFTHARVGKPGTPDAERVPLNAGVWRYHPQRHEFEVFAWGSSNPWGVDFDEEGQAFITACVIPHLYHLAQGGRYQRQAGSHFDANVFEDIQTIADHRHYVGATPHGGNGRSSEVGGGHAHCGAMIYKGNSFPDEYRGRIFMNNVHGNRMNSDSFERDGSGFVGRHEQDFLLSNDRWFRGISMKTGPDGSVYFIDWSDEQACHHKNVEIWNRTNGRMYRVRYGDLDPVADDLSKAEDGTLLVLLHHDNSWQAEKALRLLQERPTEVIRPVLENWVRGVGSPRQRLRSLWALHVTGGVDDAMTLELLADIDENLVAWSVQLAAEDREVSPEVAAAFLERARNSSSPRVRLYLASALERMGAELDSSYEIAGALLSHAEDEGDPNLSYVVWYGLSKLLTADPARGLALARGSALSRPRRLALRQLASGDAGREVLAAELVGAQGEWTGAILGALERALADRRGVGAPASWTAAYRVINERGDEAQRESALWIAAAFEDPQATPLLMAIIEDNSAPMERRVRALEALEASSAEGLGAIFLATLDVPELRATSISALAKHTDGRASIALLKLYPELDDEGKRMACSTLSARQEYSLALVGALERGDLPTTDISAFVIRNLRSYEDEDLNERVVALFGIERASSGDKLARIAQLKEQLSKPDHARTRPASGRGVYDRTCGQCHTLFGKGGDLAPDLTGSNRADLEYLLTNMVDPNAIIGRDYQVTMVRTVDGLLVAGVLKEENENGLVLQSETETTVVGLDEIEERVLSDVSAMPEGQIETLAPGELRDLVAYLGSEGQVELPAAETDVALFDGETLEGWAAEPGIWRVEDGVIIGSTEGLDHNTFLISDVELADFRFSCEVKLDGNEGNSGIQFRSRDVGGGEVAGYQADVGEGWWGRLYEEHGRAVLCDEIAPVNEGEWNAYVIEARGSRIRTWLNGKLCLDFDDPEGARSGIIALQVHSGGPTTVRFRSLSLGAMQ